MMQPTDRKTAGGAGRRPRPRGTAASREIELLDSIRRIIRGYDLHSRRLLAASKVTLAQLLCLQAVVDLGPCTARQLAGKIHLSASTMVGILDRLEAKALITRQRDHEDRRRVFVTITAAGRATVRHSPPPLGAELRDFFVGLSPARQASLNAAVRSIADRVEPATRPTA